MIQFKRGKTSTWNSSSVKLAPGQPGYDKEKHELKIGDGEHLWPELPCIGGADFVIETGTFGAWTYQKWESGIAKCWCTKEVSATIVLPIGTASFFQSTDISMGNYPITFKSPPSETASIQSSGGILWLANKQKNTKNASGEYVIISTDAQLLPIGHSVSIQVEGYWK